MSRKPTVRFKRNNNPYFKPVVSSSHAHVFGWLINQGYTVAYLSTVLDIKYKSLSEAFKNPHRFTVSQVSIILLLLKDSKYSQSDILSSLLRDSVKIDPEVKDIYQAIKLPETNEQIYRTNFDPKEHNLRH